MTNDNKTEQNGLVSVVIPTYNRSKSIKRCIDSIVKQTYKNIEIIIVDDCSSDDTEEVISNHPYPNIKYYKLSNNMRACFARNYGASKSNGEYIAFQDSDDTWDSQKIEKQIKYLKEKDVDVVFCGMRRVDATGSFYFPRYNVDVSHDFLSQELVTNAISTQTIFLKKEVMNRISFDTSFKKYQDWDFGIQIAINCSVAYLSEALATSIVSEDSISNQTSHFDAINKVYSKYSRIIDLNPGVKSRCQEKLGDCFRNNEPSKSVAYYIQSLKSHCSLRVFIKLMISLFKSTTRAK